MWYLRAMLHYADFHGRARRVEFWEFFGGWAILTMLALAADRMRVGPYEQGDNFIELAVTVAHLIPFCAVAARRSHDLNRSGWLSLLGLVPFVGLAMLVFWAFPGTSGSNRFGPEPILDPALGLSPRISIPKTAASPSRTESDLITAQHAGRDKSLFWDNPLAIVSELERLSDLLYIGSLSDAEFEDLKRQALSVNRSR